MNLAGWDTPPVTPVLEFCARGEGGVGCGAMTPVNAAKNLQETCAPDSHRSLAQELLPTDFCHSIPAPEAIGLLCH